MAQSSGSPGTYQPGKGDLDERQNSQANRLFPMKGDSKYPLEFYTYARFSNLDWEFKSNGELLTSGRAQNRRVVFVKQ